MEPSFPPCRPLRPGDRVAVVPTSGPAEADALTRGVAWLRERYRVADPPVLAPRGYLAGDDDARAAALLDALRDPDVRAVVSSRGGYGAARLLERAGTAVLGALTRDPKPLVGFSDVTALHAAWARARVRSVHGPVVTSLGRDGLRDDERAGLVAALEGGALPAWTDLEVVTPGEAHGRAAGGNLSILASLSGTPWSPDLAGCVLFLEDVGEKPYRLDRMLTTLRQAGALAGVRAVVLGDFARCDPGVDGVEALDVLCERLGDLGVPVLRGGAFGHGERQRPVALGASARVCAGGRVEFGG